MRPLPPTSQLASHPATSPIPTCAARACLSIFATASQSTITRTGKLGREFLAGLLRRERRLVRLSVWVFAIGPHMVAQAGARYHVSIQCCLSESPATGEARRRRSWLRGWQTQGQPARQHLPRWPNRRLTRTTIDIRDANRQAPVAAAHLRCAASGELQSKNN